MFHARQGLKLIVLQFIAYAGQLLINSALLSPLNTFIGYSKALSIIIAVIELLAWACIAIIFVIQLVCFIDVCRGKAKEAPLAKSINSMR